MRTEPELLNEQLDRLAMVLDEIMPNCAELVRDALELLKEQEAERNKWIKCSDEMPEERDTIFAKLKGTDKWKSAMFEKMSEDVRVVEVFEDGTRRVGHSHTVDGLWDIEKKPPKRTVTHWMPNPKLPEGEKLMLS